MKSTGIIRRVDELGRVAIPKEIRRTLRILEGDPLELFLDSGGVVFKKYSPVAMNSDWLRPVFEAIKTDVIDFFIADADEVLFSSDGKNGSRVPDEWLESRSAFSCKQAYVVPIVSSGELLGFVGAWGGCNEFTKLRIGTAAKIAAKIMDCGV